MNDDGSAEEGTVGDFDIAGQKRVVDEGDVIADGAVVGEVNASHEVVVVAEGGRCSGAGAAVNGDVFADGIAGADPDVADDAGLEGGVLGFCADDCSITDFIVGTDRGVSGYNGMGLNLAAVPDLNVLIDNDAGTDLAILTDACVGVNESVHR